MWRLGAERADAALDRPHVRPMGFTGRPMTSMPFVDREGCTGAALDAWVPQAVGFARSLSAKT